MRHHGSIQGDYLSGLGLDSFIGFSALLLGDSWNDWVGPFKHLQLHGISRFNWDINAMIVGKKSKDL